MPVSRSRPARCSPRARPRAWRTGVVLTLVVVVGSAFVAAAPEDHVVPHLVGEEDYATLSRVQEVIDDWNPRRLRNPYVETAPGVDAAGRPVARRVIRRRDLAAFIADVEAAEALGKAFFWDMQAGSDFRRDGNSFIGTACASCHYRFGTDARDTHTTRIPYVAWDRYQLDPRYPLGLGERPRPFDVAARATQPIDIPGLYDPQTAPPRPFVSGGAAAEGDAPAEPVTPLSLIVGSQGVPRIEFQGLNPQGPGAAGDPWQSEIGQPTPLPPTPPDRSPAEWAMFVAGQANDGRRFRQITPRNAPTVVNSGFADRLFHDGRAESTFNGFSIFGDDDQREVIHVRHADGTLRPVRVALPHAALASQAVGPIVNDVEMSYHGRTFPDLARKLLPAPVLGYQQVAGDDSHLGWAVEAGLVGPGTTYRRLIQRAFSRERWDGSAAAPAEAAAHGAHPEDTQRVRLALAGAGGPREGTLMEANFPLYWGLAILLYEAGLVSNQSPFDAVMEGDTSAVNRLWEEKHAGLEAVVIDRLQTKHPPPAGTPPFVFSSGAEVFQRGLRAFVSKGCQDCHEGPLFSEAMTRLDNGEGAEPIAHLVDHSLLPNSRGDAIGLVLGAAERRMLAEVAALLVASGAPGARFAAQLAGELNLLRDGAGGRQSTLTTLVAERLRAVRVAEDRADEIASVLIDFERERSRFAGDRTFFSEDERIALAKLIGTPVLLERTPVPPDLVAIRPPLPFAGPFASAPYAFYDMGFYTLGVAPPRYDRGVGDFSSVAALAHGPEGSAARRAGPQPPPPQGHHQVASGAAYRFDPAWRAGRPRSPAPAGAAAPVPAADTSWARDVPAWPDGDFPGTHSSQRRADVHFFSRARRLVLNETQWGHRKPLLDDNELMFWGGFRTPTLRNVELTAPYMHNGRLPTLMDVLEFYDRGGDVPGDRDVNPDKHPAMRTIDLTIHDQLALAFFLTCLTDERVKHERGPFDHPSLRIANGYAADFTDKVIELEAVGAGGVPADKVPPSFPAPR